MTRKKAKKSKRKVKYRTITFKVTDRQKRSLLNFCKSRHTTPNKMIKKVLNPLLNNYAALEVNTQQISVNQLQLF